MPRARHAIRRLSETPATLSSAAGGGRIPADLLQQASRRLQVMTLLGAALLVLGPALRHVALHAAQPGDARWTTLRPMDVITSAGAAASLLLWWFLRRRERDPRWVVNLGLVYLVAMALVIGIALHWDPPGGSFAVVPMITGIGPLLLLTAAVAAVPPGRMLAVGFVAASMDPLAMVLVHALNGTGSARPADLLIMHFPDYLLLGVAVVISSVVTGLGRQVSRERAMGSYRLGELLGSGGMGEVFHATHRMLARPAAIKLIRPEVLAGSDQASAGLATLRFRREAEAAANLRSPHTVELYDFGVTDEGTLYAVMELLEGMTLQTLVAEHGPLPLARAIHVLQQVCHSLEEAHASGLVHRDIKPANIHVGRLGLEHDFVKVLDFGLVKSVLEPRQEQVLATAVGLTPGTPAYMAPEMTGDEPVDGRADLYALGCVAYHLVTGRLVFDGASALQMIARHLHETPSPPSRFTPQPMPVAFDELVLRCLAKDPADRPAGAGDVSRALAAISLDLDPWGAEQARAWWDQHAHTNTRSQS
jgi:serine/threonine-protein kinase